MIIYWLCILHASHAVEEKRGALRGFATVGPPAEMRGEVKAKERGVWRRLTNRLCAGNGTNHGYSSGLCCSLFLCNSPFFLTSPSYLLLSSQSLCLHNSYLSLFLPCAFRNLRSGLTKRSYRLTTTSLVPSTTFQFNPTLGFPLLHLTLFLPLVSYSLATLL